MGNWGSFIWALLVVLGVGLCLVLWIVVYRCRWLLMVMGRVGSYGRLCVFVDRHGSFLTLLITTENIPFIQKSYSQLLDM